MPSAAAGPPVCMNISAIQTPVGAVRKLNPGLMVTSLVAMSAAFLGSHYKGSMLLFWLLLGLALHFVSEDPRCAAGIQFASSTVLRLGVALLGLRLTIEHVLTLGWQTVFAMLCTVALTIGMGLLLAKLPKSDTLERDTILTVVGVTTLSTVAMITYPIVTQWLGFDALTSGKFIGATIHDVAQVVGAGNSLSLDAGDAAAITKLMRVTFLMPVLVLISLAIWGRVTHEAAGGKKSPRLPWFTVASLVLMLINSTGWVPAAVQSGASDVSQAFFVLAIAAVGLKISLQDVTRMGWRPVVTVVLVTVFLAFSAAVYLLLTR